MVGETGAALGRRGLVVGVVAVVVVVGAVVAFLLRGNGSDGSEPVVTPSLAGTPSVSVTTSVTTPAPTETVAAPVLPEAAAKPTRAGAEAFFAYFVDLYNYAFLSLDVGPLQSASTEVCKFCAGVVDDVQSASATGQSFKGAELRLLNAVAAPGDPKKGLLVNALVDQAPGQSVDATGAVQQEIPASKNVRMDAGLRWTGSGWVVYAVKVLEK